MMATVKTTPTPLAVLQAGYGAFGEVHARAWRRHGDGVRLTIADTSAHRRQLAAEACPDARILPGVPGDLTAFHVVDIVTPADTHAALAVGALRSGCDLFVEKPFVMNSREAAEVAAVARDATRLVQVGYFYRSHPVAIALRDRLRSGRFGVPIWIDADFTSLKRPRADAGVVDNDAVHFIDLVCWLVGRPPRDVTAILRHPLGRTVEDIALVVLSWPDGPTARIQASCVVAGPTSDPVVPGGWSRKSLTVTTRNGQLVTDMMADTLTERAACLEQIEEGIWRTVVGEVRSSSFGPVTTESVVATEIDAFVAAIRERSPTIADIDSGIGMVTLCEALRRSAHEGRTVAMEQPR